MRAPSLRRALAGGSLATALVFSAAANASLVLNQSVTSSFQQDISSTGTGGNDLPGKPSTLYLGQLQATQTGIVDFFYIGNEAAYTNTIQIGGATAYSTAGLPDNFNSHLLVGSVGVAGNAFVDFGFCTTGGYSVGVYGRCAENDNAASLIAQFNYQSAKGYRSIAFRPLSSFNDSTGARTFASLGGARDLWAVFWDDSGARNDDDHDDLIAIAKWRAVPVEVPEPATTAILGAGLLALGLRRKRKVESL